MSRLRVEPERRQAARARPAPADVALAGPLRLAWQVGNRATATLLARYVGTQGSPLPAPASTSWSQQFRDAQLAASSLEGAPMRTLQVLLKVLPTGKYDQATFDALNALKPPPATAGFVDEKALDSLLPVAKSKRMHAMFARLVLATESGPVDLSMGFDPKLGTAFKSVAEGGLAKVTLGPSAFTSVAELKTAMFTGAPAIFGGVVRAAEERLGQAELEDAAAFNERHVVGIRSGDIISRVIAGGGDTSPGGSETEGFAQWVANFQARTGLEVNGRVDDPTFAKIVDRLEALGRYSSILRLVLDRYQLEHDWIADVSYDADVRMQPFKIQRDTRGPVVVQFGPKAFNSGLAGLIHTVADAMRQARVFGQDQLGGLKHSVREQEMLGKSEQLTSNLPDESKTAFKWDVNDFLAIWRALTVEERRNNLATLKNVLRAVEARYDSMGAKQVKELRKEVTRVAEEARWHISRD